MGLAVNAPVNDNVHDLERDLAWFEKVLEARLKSYFGTNAKAASPATPPDPPHLVGSSSPYARFVTEHELSVPERLALLLALIPSVRPQLLDVLWTRNDGTQRGFTEFGGRQGNSHGGFVPTGETALFLLSGDDLGRRFEAIALFDPDRFLSRYGVVSLTGAAPGEPPMSGILAVGQEYLDALTTGGDYRPGFSTDFPARVIATELDWGDLVLPPSTLDALEDIRRWVLYGATLMEDWGMRQRLSPGFTALFFGPPGTGKTLSACLLGKHCACDVYRVDLSMTVSKYIGETEKNLGRVFDAARDKGWILFFDEADALFGKRTKVEDSHDRFANQEVSFLLQRIEEFKGVTILASNLKGNIDDAFLRRFQSVVAFPMPKPSERLRLWHDAFPRQVELEETIDLADIAERHELSGGTIMNIVRYACLMAASRGTKRVLLDDVNEGIRREFLKEGRAL